MSRVPIVIVFGATGTGKSKLAIQIAKKFNGEIISADSMQVYKGLDIASNKVTQAERAEVRHHMLDILRPMDRYSVTDYRNQALPIIDDILKRQKLPIIVGGTNYYIEAVLWNMLVEPADDKSELIFHRYQVLKDPNRINKWKTYKASVVPLLRKSNQDLVTDGCDKKTDINKNITKDDIDMLIEQIKSVDCDFKNSLESIQNTMNIAYKFYKRTFYPMESEDYVTSGDVLEEPADSEIVDIVSLETTIMNEYISRNLEHMISFLYANGESEAVRSSSGEVVWKDINFSDDLDLKDSYAVLSECKNFPFNFAFLNSSRFWNVSTVCRVLSNSLSAVSYVVYADRFRSIYERQQHLIMSCYLICKKFLECVIALTKIRIKRLNVIRIVDDEVMLDFNSDEILAEVRLVDPDMVKEVHPNNRRKVIRVLQTYYSTGERMSEFQNKQRNLEGASSISGPLRFPEACLLWLHCDQEVLNARLRVRVNEMMEMGLIDELLEFHKQYNIHRLAYNLDVDYSKGIFQSIGLKEFHSYLMLSEEERNSKKGTKLLNEGIELLKAATIKYSKFQIRYMFNKFIKVPDTKKVPPIFQLDTTDLDKWQENVESKAYHIVENYLSGNDMLTLDYSPMENQQPDLTRYENGEYYCNICERLFIGAYQWQAHTRSKRHRKTLYGKKVRELKKKFATLRMTTYENSSHIEENCSVQNSV